MSSGPLTGKVAIVTGASRGIGRATALALAREGADVVCAARSTKAAPSKLPGTVDETAAAVEALGRRALAVACDISRESEVDSMVARAIDELGRVDILVNNAAVNAMAPFAETTARRWDLVLGVNLGGTVLCCRAVLPQMARQGCGSIVNLSSGAVTEPDVTAKLGIIPYAVSKAAVESLSETLALEVRRNGVSVNCLRIEMAVATEGARLMNPDGDYTGWEQPEPVAEAILWLATRNPSYSGRVMTMAEVRKELGA